MSDKQDTPETMAEDIMIVAKAQAFDSFVQGIEARIEGLEDGSREPINDGELEIIKIMRDEFMRVVPAIIVNMMSGNDDEIAKVIGEEGKK